MSNPEIDDEFWNIAIRSVIADIRSDIHAALLDIPSVDAEEEDPR